MGVHKKLSDHDFLELYNEGLMDIEIAEIMGFAIQTVWKRRTQMGLPKNPQHHRTAKVFTVYDGKTDEYIMEGTIREIGQRLGIYETTVRSYAARTKQGVPIKYKVYERADA